MRTSVAIEKDGVPGSQRPIASYGYDTQTGWMTSIADPLGNLVQRGQGREIVTQQGVLRCFHR